MRPARPQGRPARPSRREVPRTSYQPLRRTFFARDTVRVARALIGQFLVHETPSGRLVGRIVETEAYRGDRDPASHAYRRTARSEVMYGPAGIAYVYLSYGVHYCMNVVTEGRNRPGAVLLRALELVEGSRRRTRAANPRVASGPGRLTAAMRVGPQHHAADLTRPPLYLARGTRTLSVVASGPRIGVGSARTRRWRFGVAGHPSLSRPFRAHL
ncbi:MAG: DNA-3-methyladenine glycosylase [bacterium]